MQIIHSNEQLTIDTSQYFVDSCLPSLAEKKPMDLYIYAYKHHHNKIDLMVMMVLMVMILMNYQQYIFVGI